MKEKCGPQDSILKLPIRGSRDSNIVQIGTRYIVMLCGNAHAKLDKSCLIVDLQDHEEENRKYYR